MCWCSKSKQHSHGCHRQVSFGSALRVSCVFKACASGSHSLVIIFCFAFFIFLVAIVKRVQYKRIEILYSVRFNFATTKGHGEDVCEDWDRGLCRYMCCDWHIIRSLQLHMEFSFSFNNFDVLLIKWRVFVCHIGRREIYTKRVCCTLGNLVASISM